MIILEDSYQELETLLEKFLVEAEKHIEDENIYRWKPWMLEAQRDILSRNPEGVKKISEGFGGMGSLNDGSYGPQLEKIIDRMREIVAD